MKKLIRKGKKLKKGSDIMDALSKLLKFLTGEKKG